MNPRVERYRQSWRLRIPPDPSETRRIERWLATARVFLAVSTLVAIRMDPTELGNSWAAYGLFVFYLANGILIIMLLKRRQQSTAGFRLLVHAGDVVWPALISIFAEGPRAPFYLFFFFVLAAAAYRWGLWETLGTAAAEVALLWIERFVLVHHLAPAVRCDGSARSAREYKGVRARTVVHAVGVLARDGFAAGVSSRAAEAFAGGESSDYRDSVAGEGGSGTDWDD